jgi:hypothetical protein
VRTILTSTDVMGGPSSFTMLYPAIHGVPGS